MSENNVGIPRRLAEGGLLLVVGLVVLVHCQAVPVGLMVMCYAFSVVLSSWIQMKCLLQDNKFIIITNYVNMTGRTNVHYISLPS